MSATKDEDVYATIIEPMNPDSPNYAYNIDNAVNQGNISAPGEPENHIYLENQEPDPPNIPITDQRQTSAAPPTAPGVPQNQTSNSYPPATPQQGNVNQGYVPTGHYPPSYNELYGKGQPGQPGFNSGPYTQQPQPWGQELQPNLNQGNVVVTTQPQSTPSNVVFVNSAPQRNPAQGLATASLVMAIIGIFCCFCSIFCTIPAIVFAAISLGSSYDPEKARTHAKISMTCTVLGWVSGIIIAVIYVIWITSLSYNSYDGY